ncbi:hypothetical protein Amet_1843 [Alkaliphilus metalliredigens QYMF]|uniref:Uncharacterized protein n=1 Tax=Alkaliphilus metalliredigens (strain QYMF) TaxID=293826 RepID=A6TP95_ALKMQ|nr:hypothetical protein [Alkaliphilus metalliredigens]ABR48013.1 hypothetical protein Amet_1843 [Alkaliphilus metalliredigens QYMF]
MELDFIDVIFNILIGISILLAAIGTVFRYTFDAFLFGYFFTFFTNKEDKKGFNGILKNSWKTSALFIVLSIVPLTLAFIIHLIFRK